MFKSIRTSGENKLRITELTSKLQLGAENVIARIAFSYSIQHSGKLDLKKIKDVKGKEYNSRVLFGDFIPYYIAMVCELYGIYKTDTTIQKYVKLHIDDGIELIAEQTNKKGIDFILDEVEAGLAI